MYKNRLVKIIYEELKRQDEEEGESFVGDPSGKNDFTDICLDGYFDLNKVAEKIMEELQDE